MQQKALNDIEATVGGIDLEDRQRVGSVDAMIGSINITESRQC